MTLSRRSDFDQVFDRLATVEGYLATARSSATRVPATNPMQRAMRSEIVERLVIALNQTRDAMSELVELEKLQREE
jgi:hypothetical protein